MKIKLTEPASPLCILDWAAALKRLEGDQALLSELAILFCDERPGLLAALRAAIASKNAPALRIAAHSLKGALATFAALEAAGSASQLESLAAAGDLDGAAELVMKLEAQVDAVCRAMRAITENAHVATSAIGVAPTGQKHTGVAVGIGNGRGEKSL